MRRRRIRVLGGLALGAAAFGGAQLFQPPPPRASLPGDGPMSDFVTVPGDVEALLREACYDCHSDETRWPWYARISPISWLLARDVEHGRSNLDYSLWSTDPVREPTPEQRLTWMCRDIREGIMPPRLYLLLHREARLSEEEIDAICDWTEEALRRLDGGA